MSLSPRSESPVNVDDWINENKKFFLPPVCNRMMHDGQLKVFFVGGPNVRQDYHLNEGEEFFFMIRGDMCLKVVEKGKHKDVIIREGEVFLLPAKVPHSPQRKANTVGLVIERERRNWERDGLRYYVGSSNVVLYERWFHCVDLGSQLKPIIDEFFNSQEFQTQKPGKNSFISSTPYANNDQVTLMKPFSVMDWMRKNEDKFEEEGMMHLFNGKFQSVIEVYGHGEHLIEERAEEMFFWQLESDCSTFLSFKSQLGLEDGGQLFQNQCIVIPVQSRCRLVNEGSKARTLVVSMPSPAPKT